MVYIPEPKVCGNCHKSTILDNIKFTNKGKIHKFYGKDICIDCIEIVTATVKADPYYNYKASYKDGLNKYNPSHTAGLALARKKSYSD